MRAPSPLSLLLIAVAVFSALAHICAGPLHAHAAAVTAHEDHHSEHGDGDIGHGGSCEGVTSTAIVAAPAVASALTGIAIAHGAARSAPRLLAVPAPTSSPPLFLLHAALLI
jgi:hypothetical protein